MAGTGHASDAPTTAANHPDRQSDHRADPSFGPAKRRAAITTATAVRRTTGRELRLGDKQALVVKNVQRDIDGVEHVHYNRTYAGLPVIGGDLVVHQDKAGNPQTVDWASRADIKVASLTPTISAARVRGTGDRRVIFAANHKPVLAWESHVTGHKKDGTPIDDLVYTDARSGNQLGVWHGVQTDTGTGNALYSGSVPLTTTKSGTNWVLTDGSRGGHSTYDANNSTSTAKGTLFSDADNIWGNGATSSRQTAAVDAHYGAAMTWDFYKYTFSRTGIRNDGVGAYSRVHYGSSYQNAFWDDSCFCMTYGDGGATLNPLVALDVAGHEMSHGVTSATAGLAYSGDAGGLNEATSDVMGTMVEFYANNANDPGDYYIGEKIMKDGTYLRRM
ncbi:MAG: M4 family metallopeptidase, partial [Actinomycetota bacterium]|nr:M4 family metallopeptidase [Actinomycetota bacterium]